MDNLLRFKENLYLIADFETENLNTAMENRPWQVAFLLCNNKEILEKHHYYIWWDNLKMSDGAARVTKFNKEEYKRLAKPQLEVYEIWKKYLYNPEYIKVFHNGINFDCYIEQIWRKENNLPRDFSFLDNFIDTNSLARMIKLGIKSVKREDWLVNWFKFGNFRQKNMKTNLTSLGKEYGIDWDYDSLHEALSDVGLNYAVWNKMKWMIDI